MLARTVKDLGKGLIEKLFGTNLKEQLSYLYQERKRLPWSVFRRHWKWVRHSKSQFFQDIYSLDYVGDLEKGYFVEIGVGVDGLFLSNSYMFETQLGWKGILCEPNPAVIDIIRKNRSTPLDTRAVYKENGKKVRFARVDDLPGLSTISEFTESDSHKRSVAEYVEVETITFYDLLQANNAPRMIDFLSVDTEGSELDILSGFPFEEYQFRFVCIEHNHRPGVVEQLDDLMLSNGYKRVYEDISNVDAWYALEQN